MSLKSSMGRFGRRWGALTLAFVLAGMAGAWGQDSRTGQMRIDNDVDIPMSDGLRLKANVYRPDAEGKYPALVTLSAYGKDNLWERYFPQAFKEELALYPDLCRNGSSCKYLLFEAPDPERWVPNGYVIVNVDTRGAAKSPGYLNPWSQQEARDYYEAIEWAAAQPWSNGKIGLLGISYYAMVQWMVAALQPPHLAAILPWEGTEDFYREWVFHGGIYTNVMLRDIVYGPAIVRTQHGNPAYVDPVTGERGGGPIALSPELLAGNRIDLPGEAAKHFLDDEWMRARRPDLSRIKVPLLSAGNWGGLAQHLRGNTEGFMGAASKEKWLSMHTGTHFEKFYIPESVALQMRFFDHYLKGIDNGWEKEPRVQLAIRRPGGESLRKENEWPIARTQWTKFYLNAQKKSLGLQNPATENTVSYQAMSDGVTFTTNPFEQDTEITGPIAAHLWVSSSTDDMDIFATIQAFGPDGKEVTFRGANDPAVPVTQGWLRVSHRKLDPVRSKPYRPWHSHDEVQKLKPGELYAVDVEIWPTSMVFPKGYRLSLVLEGKDFERPIDASGAYKGMNSPVTYRGSGAFLHNERDPVEFGGTNRIISGGQHESYLLLPVIPPK
jgi:uncharacterized protein